MNEMKFYFETQAKKFDRKSNSKDNVIRSYYSSSGKMSAVEKYTMQQKYHWCMQNFS